ncbi:MAG: O-antigen ligase family protein [Planctomycetes bacterium]|nr:O-antigen ligase family protein [Planctomycetota bacterium]
MSNAPQCPPEPFRPLQVVLIVIAAAALAAGALLLSADTSPVPVDGAIEWQQESLLRVVVATLCLNYNYPTFNAGDVKMLVLGAAAGLALTAIGVAYAVGRRRAETPVDDDPGRDANGSASRTGMRSVHVAPLVASQVLVGMYLLWSFASSRWSRAPDLAIGASVLLSIQFLWSFGLGFGLNARAARVVAWAVVCVTALTGVVAIWYFYGRNTTIPAKFPYGNPGFLAACLVPGILLSVSMIIARFAPAFRKENDRSLRQWPIAALAILLAVWAFLLSESRGASVGLAVGLLAMACFALRGRARLLPLCAAIAGAVLVGWLLFQANEDTSGRTATTRFRPYAWSYAWRMFEEKPITGHGQGGFVLAGDAYTIDDVERDPLVFVSRIAHAHNEWLEIMADLGSIGIVLILAALGLTIHAGMAAIKRAPSPTQRWILIGLLASLVALLVDACFGTGLRVSGVPMMFYTLIGLIWAMSAPADAQRSALLTGAPLRRSLVGVLTAVLGVAVLTVSVQDFSAARGAYGAAGLIAEGDYDAAVRLARRGSAALNPQRALANLYRLAESHTRIASNLAQRGEQRAARARATAIHNPDLLALAARDLEQSEQHCKDGSEALRELVRRSPSYTHSDLISYSLNRIEALNAAARGDETARDQYLIGAAASIERELRRQPFSPTVALEYVRSAGQTLEMSEQLEVLARPLRHDRIPIAFVDYLVSLVSSREFAVQLDQIVRTSLAALKSPTPGEGLAWDPWAPEKLRLAARVFSARGDKKSAVELLTVAEAAYDWLAPSAPLGAASFYAQLAEMRFAASPDNPSKALDYAVRAIEVAPSSESGRALRRDIENRMVVYHLAAGEEAAAVELLASGLLPRGTSEDKIMHQVGATYGVMAHGAFFEAGGQLMRQAPTGLPAAYGVWIERATQLAGDDFRVLSLAADAAFRAGNVSEAVAHLRGALELNPYDPSVAVAFLSLAGADVSPERFVDVIARPLRRRRVDELLGFAVALATDPNFAERGALVLAAARKIEAAETDHRVDSIDWAPEKLRLAATMHFIQGEYERSEALLDLAIATYRRMSDVPPLAAASAYSEQADARFFNRPDQPYRALDSAKQLLTYPIGGTSDGRILVQSLRTRMVWFYLADGDEDSAGDVLRSMAIATVSDEDISGELGIRYAGMCNALLHRKQRGMPIPIQQLPVNFARWVARAVELDPADPDARMLAADVAFRANDEEACVAHLVAGLANGLPKQRVLRFLELARTANPQARRIEALWREIGGMTSTDNEPQYDSGAKERKERVSPPTPPEQPSDPP